MNTGLAIIDLAESSAPLTGYPDRFLPFFGQSAFVNNKSGIVTATKKTISIHCHLIHYWQILPGGMGRKVVQ